MSEWLIILAVIVLAVLYLIYQANKQPQFNPAPVVQPVKADLTYEQLVTYNGSDRKQVYVALKGTIYDVSSSQFYGVGGGYHQFAGHDASINLAKMSHDKQFLDKHGDITLDKEQEKVLSDWVARFQMKYPKIGKVIKTTTQ